jgi:hypothetical protein
MDYGFPLSERLVVVAAHEAGTDPTGVVEPLGPEEFGGELCGNVDVGDQLPHPLDRSVDEDIDLD